MTHFGFHGDRLKCFKVAQRYFLQKPQTEDPVQMGKVFAFNESANTKIAFYTYLRLTLNETYVDWA